MFFNMDYYQVKPKNKPGVQGTLIGRLGNQIDVIVGSSIWELGLSIDERGDVVSSKGCIVQQISCMEKAEYMKGYESWKHMQTLTATPGGPLPLSGKTFLNGLY